MDVILYWLELIMRIANIWIVKKETWNQIQVFLIIPDSFRENRGLNCQYIEEMIIRR